MSIPLPEPYWHERKGYLHGPDVSDAQELEPLFTTAQLHSYAAACVSEAVAAERERRANVCEDLRPQTGEIRRTLNDAAAAIRAPAHPQQAR